MKFSHYSPRPTAPREGNGGPVQRYAWLCPLFAVVFAAGVLAVFGLTWRNAIFAALLLVCPAVILWGFIILRKAR